MATTETSVPEVANATAEEENRFHYYVGSQIPWYVHLIWVLFWTFSVYYAVSNLLPSLQTELLSPP